MTWEVLHDGHWDTTERMEIPGGWLVRTVWRKAIDMGQPHLDGSAIVFVPTSAEELAARLSRPIEEPEDGEESEVNPVEVDEGGSGPEQVGVGGPDHKPRRRRKGDGPRDQEEG